MSVSEKGRRLVREIRESLIELEANGVDRVPRAAPPAPNAPGFRPAVAPLDTSRIPRGGDSERALRAVVKELGDCTRCRLHEGRRNIVFGEGSPEAPVVFVGEGPGEQEDRSGRPFVGRAGELLTKMIEAVGWTREDVYICNIVKCRPPKNRDPQLDEVASCSPFLEKQIRAIAPRVIVTLGKPAAQKMLGRPVAITRARGTWEVWHGIPLMPTYHPAYLLRNYTKETRQAVWDDLRAVRARVDGA